MLQRKYKRWLLIALTILVASGVVAFIGFQYAIKSLKSQIEQVLGTESEVGAIHLSWESVKIDELRIHAPKG